MVHILVQITLACFGDILVPPSLSIVVTSHQKVIYFLPSLPKKLPLRSRMWLLTAGAQKYDLKTTKVSLW